MCAQLSGGGLVPLSHAICCRPCLPEELPQLSAAIAADDKAVAIMSIGCHASRGAGPDTLKCEDGSNSIVSGAQYSEQQLPQWLPVILSWLFVWVTSRPSSRGEHAHKGCQGSAKTLMSTLRALPWPPGAGWAQAVQVSPSVDAWYPLGAAACCTPALLLGSGDAWELERCGCGEAADVNCGGTASHRLLSGFKRWRCASAFL